MAAPHVGRVLEVGWSGPLSDLGEAALVEDSVAYPTHQCLDAGIHAAHVTQLLGLHLHQSLARMNRWARFV